MPRGLGSPLSLTTPLGDTGLGSPHVTSQTGNLGLGSSFSVPVGLDLLPPAFEYEVYPDEGGVVVRLLGSWPSTGPFVVRLQATGGGPLYPEGKPGCYSGTIGQGHLCYTDPSRRLLSFVLPPLAPGDYNVIVQVGSNPLVVQQVVVSGLQVVYRAQAEEVYRSRQTFPPLYTTGPRDWLLEELAVPSQDELGVLESMTRAFGQVLQQANGAPQTKLMVALAPTATTAVVESTLGCPDAGSIWIGTREYTYTSKTIVSFNGLQLAGPSDGTSIPPLTPVTLKVSDLLPTE